LSCFWGAAAKERVTVTAAADGEIF